mmetsp:Transcript_22863/g.34112  ORF Transcript_22863/g.34112 Transcript_22863/m.34112 type:complete len:235 (-) Transcript_22863:130-834(-)|eukprot:CAMPEP_0167752130 /NCGR_PEP_ID=MMETSP0110_2-20121227/6959_1 /TAXON_ID=629695 /ORGANISM="Gymnochlora sp., Strain CCMP2014" /LENGTH=234 /DNA_ID=CAMNT_0007637695 /DNA_START=34 /DNA_END=738 /DNA_ORIENTATION=-
MRSWLASSVALNAFLAFAMVFIVTYTKTSQNNDLAAVVGPRIARDVSVNARKNQFKSGRRCGLTGKHGTTAYSYCFSHKRATKRQNPNIQQKYVYWPEGQRMVKMKVSTSALKSIEKRGIEAMAKDAGIELSKLPFKDLRPERQEYVEKHRGEVPVSKKWVSGHFKKAHRMKNPEKLAASKKTPLQGKYYHGKIFFGRFTEDQLKHFDDVEEVPVADQYEEGLEVEDVSADNAA